jgi:hypothetical protein
LLEIKKFGLSKVKKMATEKITNVSSQFTAHNAPRTMHHGQFTAHYSPRTIPRRHNSPPAQFIAGTIHRGTINHVSITTK